ncbi:Protein kinase superfamily protein [Forsythia ovata]|uniref:non-specific serine/threonine protein kinase n=1 Tax=Forsythia ovata TaxID=205694 RepID=A0ABD1X3E3_9LAMI
MEQNLKQNASGLNNRDKLSSQILVAVKVLKIFKGNGEEFINEVGTIGRIYHVNVVRLAGYCTDGYRRALVYEFLPNDSLEKFISSGNQSRTLGWEKLQQIAIGIAKGLDYLHHGCNQQILHFDIKPHNILLDHNFSPKVSDFVLAKLCSKDQSVVSMTAARGTIGYIAPEVFWRNYGNVLYKADVYSFGILLIDIVGGRKNVRVAE